MDKSSPSVFLENVSEYLLSEFTDFLLSEEVSLCTTIITVPSLGIEYITTELMEMSESLCHNGL